MLSADATAPLVLIVEDDESHAELIRRAFESSPETYRLCTVGALSDARQRLEKARPDLILTDYRLPDGDGHDLVAMVNQTCPVVMMTSQGNEQIAVEAMKAGALEYVVKSGETFAALPRITRQVLREWNLIQERKRLQEERSKVERLESLGVLAGGIAHDFNNLLMAIQGHISLARHALPAESKAGNSLAVAEKACQSATQLSQRLIAFAKGSEPLKQVVSPGKLLHNCLMLLGDKLRVDLRISDDLHNVDADEGQLHQVFSNIIVNAQQAMPDGGRLRVSAENMLLDGETLDLKPGKYVRIAFADEGCGIDEKILPRIFDPYFSTKTAGNGLGLASSYAIIARHGGRLSVASPFGKGAVFTIHLPARKSDAEPDLSRQAVNLTIDRQKNILVMDDEEMLRNLQKELLQQIGYRVTVCADGAEAVSLYKAAKELDAPFSAVILDLVTHGMGGKEAARQILEYDAKARLIVTSGYCEEPILGSPEKYGFKGALVKPYALGRLVDVLHSCILPSSAAVGYRNPRHERAISRRPDLFNRSGALPDAPPDTDMPLPGCVNGKRP